MKKTLIVSFTLCTIFQFGSASADFKVVENPTPGQAIYWTMTNDKASPCAWYEVWEVLTVQNGVAKLKKVKAPSVSFTGKEIYEEVGKLSSWSSEEDAKRASDNSKCHLKKKFVSVSSPEELYEKGVKYAKKKEYDKAIPLFLEAAKQGHANAQLTLGVYYDNGTGLTTNFAKSSYWYRKAAEQGNKGAQFYLAMHYRSGKGVEKSIKDAIFWCEKSANQGDLNAQHYLGILYEEQNNYSLAYKWYTLSVKQGHEDAKARLEKLKIKMNPEQISKGERLVKEWFES